MEAKHTKGEWQANAPNPYADESAGERRTYHWVVRTSYEPSNGGACGHQVCEISSMNTGTEEADARLIAAAPDLLEACQTFAEWLRREDAGFPAETRFNTPEGEAKWREWFDENIRICALAQKQARAAIAKATQKAGVAHGN